MGNAAETVIIRRLRKKNKNILIKSIRESEEEMAGTSSYCISCLLRKQEEQIRGFEDERKKAEYMKEFCRIIAESGPDDSAPVLVSYSTKLLKKYFGVEKVYEEEKNEYNQLMLKYEDDICERIYEAEDPLKEALKYARVGNYIDFGAMNHVEKNQLEMLLSKVQEDKVDEEEYQALRNDLKKAHTLVYLTDNCGEIVLDKLFIKEIKNQYPDIKITVVVRGEPVINDATMEDAAAVGMDKIVDVIGNGTDTAGTPLEYVGEDAKTVIQNADVILAKGQGNFESLNGCGLNIYYLFLCKCDWFVKSFRMKLYEGVLVNEKNLSEKMDRKNV